MNKKMLKAPMTRQAKGSQKAPQCFIEWLSEVKISSWLEWQWRKTLEIISQL